MKSDQETNLTPEIKQELFYLVHETAQLHEEFYGFELAISITWAEDLIVDINEVGVWGWSPCRKEPSALMLSYHLSLCTTACVQIKKTLQ